MIYKVLGSIVIICALVLGTSVLYQEGFLPISSDQSIKNDSKPICEEKTPSEQLRRMIEADFKDLYSNKELPAEWSKIGDVKVIRNSNLANALLGENNPSFKTLENGPFYLEVELIDLEEELNPGIILQASLFHKKTENKVFEIGRTYTMNDLNKVASKKDVSSSPATKQTPPTNTNTNTNN